jgi:hypothetical protein
MIEPILSELEESLSVHDRTVKIGFMIYELLSTAGYSDVEIAEVGSAVVDIVG